MRNPNQLTGKTIAKKTIVLALGAIFTANLFAMSILPTLADGDKRDDGGKKIIIVVGPVTKTHDKKH